MSPTVALPLIAFVAALLFTPITSRLAHLKGWVDVPGLRKVHSFPVAYLGGASVMAALLVALAVGLLLPSTAEILASGDRRLAAIVVGTLLMFATGLVDDVKDMRATKKLGLQILGALIVVSSGVVIDGISLAEGVRIEFGIFGYLITLLWIVGATNAVNIIDGLDGLASGLSIVASAAIAWTAMATGHPVAAAVAVTLMGAILGFIPYNLHPAKVFLGDAGSLSIGFLLASMGALIATGAPTLLGFGVPLIALGIPIFDTVFAMTRRLIERRSMMSPDRNHLHHRLLRLGYGQPKVVGVLCVITAIACALVAVASSAIEWGGAFAVLLSLLGYVLLFRAAGAVRLRDSFEAVARVASLAKTTADRSQVIDHLQLQLSETTNINQWWSALEQAAAKLEFSKLEIRLMASDGVLRKFQWTSPTPAVDESGMEVRPVVFEIPVSDGRAEGYAKLRVATAGDASIEMYLRRLAAFGVCVSGRSIEPLLREQVQRRTRRPAELVASGLSRRFPQRAL